MFTCSVEACVVSFLILVLIPYATSSRRYNPPDAAPSHHTKFPARDLSSICAIRPSQDKYVFTYYEHCDAYSATFVMYRLGQQWMAFFQSLITAIILGVTCLLFMVLTTSDSMIGMGLSNISAVGFMMSFLVANMVELESRMTSVERLQYYSTAIPQGLVSCPTVLPKAWAYGQSQQEMMTRNTPRTNGQDRGTLEFSLCHPPSLPRSRWLVRTTIGGA